MIDFGGNFDPGPTEYSTLCEIRIRNPGIVSPLEIHGSATLIFKEDCMEI